MSDDSVLRGLISVGGKPDDEEGFLNWKRFEYEGFGYDFPDLGYGLVYLALQSHYRWSSNPPDFAALRHRFEVDGHIEACDALDEALKSRHVPIRTMFLQLCKDRRRELQAKEFRDIANTANSIATSRTGFSVDSRQGLGREFTKKYGRRPLMGVADAQLYRNFHEEHLDTKYAESEKIWKKNTMDFIQKPIRPLDYWFPHFGCYRGRPTGFIGYPSSFKTYLTLELAVCVAAGIPTCWGGLSLLMNGPVVWLDYEFGPEAWEFRVHRIVNGLITKYPDIKERLADNLVHEHFPELNINSPRFASEFTKTYGRYKLAFIDSLSSATPGTDENKREAADSLKMLGSITDRGGPAFAVIHHDGKAPVDPNAVKESARMNAIGGRGTSAYAGAFGATIKFRKDGRILLTQGKDGEAKQGTQIILSIEDVGNNIPNSRPPRTEGIQFLRVIDPAEAVLAMEQDMDERMKIIEFVRMHPGSTRQEIQEVVKRRNGEFLKMVNHLVEQRALRVEKKLVLKGKIESPVETFFLSDDATIDSVLSSPSPGGILNGSWMSKPKS